MPLTYPFAHVVESFSKGIDQQGPFYQVKYLFDDWANSDDVVNQLRGYTVRSGDTTIRVPPHTHPLSPNLYCTEAYAEGGQQVNNANGLPAYTGPFTVTATYRGSSYVAAGQPGDPNSIDPTTPVPWATQELDFEDELYTIPNHTFIYQSDKVHSVVPMTIHVPITVMTITFFGLPYLPTPAIRSLRGKVNNATFMGSPTGCLLFKGGKTHREFNTDGTVVQTVSLVFHERVTGQEWNKVPRHDKFQTWETIQDGSATLPYALANFSPLITL